MKLSPNEQKVMERMAPGVFCNEGFLGEDTRPLGEILDEDRSTLVGLGVSAGAIGEGLAKILDQAESAYGGTVEVSPAGQAVFHEAMGRIPCPFGDGVFHKGQVEWTLPDGRVFRFTPLSVHLVTAHGFFQGRGSRYRLDPKEIADALELI